MENLLTRCLFYAFPFIHAPTDVDTEICSLNSPWLEAQPWTPWRSSPYFRQDGFWRMNICSRYFWCHSNPSTYDESNHLFGHINSYSIATRFFFKPWLNIHDTNRRKNTISTVITYNIHMLWFRMGASLLEPRRRCRIFWLVCLCVMFFFTLILGYFSTCQLPLRSLENGMSYRGITSLTRRIYNGIIIQYWRSCTPSRSIGECAVPGLNAILCFLWFTNCVLLFDKNLLLGCLWHLVFV